MNSIWTWIRCVAAVLAIGQTSLGDARAEKAPRPFEVSATAAKAIVGKPADGEITISIAQADAYIARAAPLTIKLEADDNLALATTLLKRKDAVAADDSEKARRLKFLVTATPRRAGRHTVRAHVRFYFCTPTICERKTAHLNVVFDASAP